MLFAVRMSLMKYSDLLPIFFITVVLKFGLQHTDFKREVQLFNICIYILQNDRHSESS